MGAGPKCQMKGKSFTFLQSKTVTLLTQKIKLKVISNKRANPVQKPMATASLYDKLEFSVEKIK